MFYLAVFLIDHQLLTTLKFSFLTWINRNVMFLLGVTVLFNFVKKVLDIEG